MSSDDNVFLDSVLNEYYKSVDFRKIIQEAQTDMILDIEETLRFGKEEAKRRQAERMARKKFDNELEELLDE